MNEEEIKNLIKELFNEDNKEEEPNIDLKGNSVVKEESSS